MAYKNIIVETEDHVTLVKLHRPDALNALNLELLGELGDALPTRRQMTRCAASSSPVRKKRSLPVPISR